VELLRGGKGVGALNVKGIGEIPNVPTAAAIANAVADAVGVRIDTLPITAEKVLRALCPECDHGAGPGRPAPQRY
jgi:CO/xanthine dehydrogenase Mo-binding subunit